MMKKKNFYIAKLDDLAIKVAEAKGEMIGVNFQTECFFFDLRDNYIMNINKPFASYSFPVPFFFFCFTHFYILYI